MAARPETGRRGFLGGAVALAAAAGLGVARRGESAGEAPAARGRLKQSVSRWCFGKMTLDELCVHAARIGYRGIDLLGPEDWPVVRKHGLVCALGSLGGPVTIEKGLNRVEHHGRSSTRSRRASTSRRRRGSPSSSASPATARGCPTRRGSTNCARGCEQIAPHAEEKGVTLCVELLNSKVDHKDYMCDHTAWGVALVQEGRLAAGEAPLRHLPHADHGGRRDPHDPREHRRDRATTTPAGVPGRHEIDDTPGAALPGDLPGHRRTPATRASSRRSSCRRTSPCTSLEAAFRICDV